MKRIDFDTEFKNPGSEYRSIPFWEWNDKLEIPEIRRQIREMKARGIGGFFIHSRDGLETEYLGSDWFECVSAAVDEAKRNGMYVWLYDEDRWPSGTCGGSTTRDGENGCKGLTLEVCRSAPKGAGFLDNVLALYKAEINENELYRLERIGRTDVLNVNDSETLLVARLERSEGSEWFNNSPPPDNLSFKAVRAFIDSTYERYKDAAGGEFGRTIPGIFTDEPSLADRHTAFNPQRGWIPWTYNFEEYFYSLCGYDILDAVPYLYFNGEKSEKSRYDYWRTVSERFKEVYWAQIGSWCRENGLLFTGHFLQEDKLGLSCRVNGSIMPAYAAEDIPAIDMLTERTEEYMTVKQCVSVASQLGRAMTLSEMYGCTGWNFSFEGQKWIGDWQYVLGINQRCQHLALYSLRGCRKRDYPPSINCNNSWFKYYKTVEDYFARAAYMLRRGKALREVLVIHPMSTVWSRMGCSPYGNPKRSMERDIPSLNEFGGRFNALIKNLCQNHYDCDLGDEIIIGEHGSFGGGKFVVGKCEYDTVIVPSCENILSETCARLIDFMNGGNTVLGLAPFPRLIEGEKSEKSAQLVNHPNFVRLSSENELFEYMGKNVKHMVSITGESGEEEKSILYQLRYDGNGYILFLVNNDRKNSHSVYVRLSVSDMAEKHKRIYVYLLDLLSGNIFDCEYEIQDGCICLKEYFDNCQSLMLYITDKIMECERRDVFEGRIRAEKGLLEKKAELYEIPLEYEGFRNDTKNILTLDMCRYRMDGEYSEVTEVWRAQAEIRRKLDMRPVHRNGIEQRYRWINTPHRNDGKEIQLEFEFNSLTDIDEAELIAERPESFKMGLDGRELNNKPEGYFFDKEFKRVRLPRITKGLHKLTLICGYQNSTELECCYIAGEFGVSAERNIIQKPKHIEFGDITVQGYYHYAGGIDYIFSCVLEEKPKARIYLDSGEFEGICAFAAVNGKRLEIPWHSAGTACISQLLRKGKNNIVINVCAGLGNMLGPFHITDKPTVTSDKCFCPSDESYTPAYRTESFGLIKPPRLICYDRKE